MSRILVKDRRVVVSGGRVLTGDAPCCCDGGGDDPVCADRGGICWTFSSQGITQNTWREDDTDGCPYLTIFGGTLVVASEINVLSGVNTTFTDDDINGPNENLPVVFSYTQLIGSGIDVTVSSMSFRANIECGANLLFQWPDLDPNALYVVSVGIGSSSGDVFFWQSSIQENRPPSPLGVPVPNLNECPDDPRFSGPAGFGGTVTVTGVVSETCDPIPRNGIARKCGSTETVIFDFADNTQNKPGIEYQGDIYQATANTTSDDAVAVNFVDDLCPDSEPVEWPLAVECEGSAQITYDPAQRPQGALTLIVGQARYTPIAGVGTDDPTDGVWTNDPCPDPGGDAIYRVNRCNSTQPARWYDIVNGELVERTIGYRPGDGMAPGEGHVVVNAIEGAGCLHSVGAQPTTVELTTEPDLILTSRRGPCASRPARLVDTRPQCQPQDGGGGFDDADNVNLNAQDDANIPQLGDLVEQAIRTITLNTLLPCASCERRKEVLNRYGERIGRAILRRLNW